MIASRISSRLRSRNLYFSLVSSPIVSFASIGIGGTRDGFSIVIASARTSIWPVGWFGLMFFSSRFRTVPVIKTTNSLRAWSAVASISGESDESSTTCTVPVTSLSLMNNNAAEVPVVFNPAGKLNMPVDVLDCQFTAI